MTKPRQVAHLAWIPLLVLLASTVFAQETPVLLGPENPPPLGVVETWNGDSPHDGLIGRTPGKWLGFEYIVLTNYTDVWWSPLENEVKLSMDGGEYDENEIMDLATALTNLPGGVVGWEGTTFIEPDKMFVGWGYNAYGQCNPPIPNNGFAEVDGGDLHTLTLKTDGTILVWGDNYYGQLNVPVPNADFVMVAAGRHHNLAIKSDETLVAWGSNSHGQLNIPAPNSDFAEISGGYNHSLAVKTDRTVVAWGGNSYGQCDVPPPNSHFEAVSAGGGHSLGLKTDRTVVAWGYNINGQCNVPAPNADFVAVAAGGYHSLGLKSDGTIVAWGENGNGQCNVPAPNADFIGIAVGESHSLGLKSDSTVVAWGWNSSGQCNVPAPNSDFVAVAAGHHHSLGLRAPVSNLVYTRCLMTVTEEDSITAIPLDNPADLELPAVIGGQVPVPGVDKFLVRLQMFASYSYTGPYEPHLDFFDAHSGPGADGMAHSSFDWGYYWYNASPWMVEINGLTLDEGGTETIGSDLLAADDVESPPEEIVYTIAPEEGSQPPRHGTLYLGTMPLDSLDTFTQEDIDNDLLSYTHDGSETSDDSFTFNVQDADGGLAHDGEYTVFTFPITVNLANDLPIALPDTFVTQMNTVFQDTFRAHDPDSEDLLFIITENGDLGSVSLLDPNLGTFEYTPLPDVMGTDTLRFQVWDGEDMSNEATDLVVIENNPPVANNGEGTTWEDIPYDGTLSADDPDPHDLEFRIDVNGSKGTAEITNAVTGEFTYTPNTSSIGYDSFTFIVNDGYDDSEPGTFTVHIRANVEVGDVIVSDSNGSVILVDPTINHQAVVASGLSQNTMRGIDIYYTGDLFVVDAAAGILRIDPLTGEHSVACGPENFTEDPGPYGIAMEGAMSYLVADGPQGIVRVDVFTGETSILASGGHLVFPAGVCVVPDQVAIVSDAGSQAGDVDRIIRIDPESGNQTVLCEGFLLDFSMGIDVAPDNYIFVNSGFAGRIVMVDPMTGDQMLVSEGGVLGTPFGLVIVKRAPTPIETDDIPERYILLPAVPNPFNPRTELRFELPEAATVTLSVYDASGRLVKILARNESCPAGRYTYVWNGRDDTGHSLASGVYLYRLRAGSFDAKGKVVLLK